ncbi:MAG: hypothetical protein WDO56_19835 [Gammaproteobacteria bacterium]
MQHLEKRDGLDARLLDLRDFPMPFFDQPMPPAAPGRPPFEHEAVRALDRGDRTVRWLRLRHA